MLSRHWVKYIDIYLNKNTLEGSKYFLFLNINYRYLKSIYIFSNTNVFAPMFEDWIQHYIRTVLTGDI